MMDLARLVEDKFYAAILTLPESDEEVRISIRSLAIEVVSLICGTFSKSSQSDHSDPPQSPGLDRQSFLAADGD